jgi:hypothetical protein
LSLFKKEPIQHIPEISNVDEIPVVEKPVIVEIPKPKIDLSLFGKKKVPAVL